MLEELAPFFELLVSIGWTGASFTADHSFAVVLVVVTALFGVARTVELHVGRCAVASIGLAVAGQGALFSDWVILGILLFLLSFVMGMRVGWLVGVSDVTPAWSGPREVVYIGLLLLVAATVRGYAIDELPWFVDVEPGTAFLQGLSSHGLSRYVETNRVQDDGFVHMVARWLVGGAVGPSILSLRLVSLVFGASAVALCYGMIRLFAPPGFALLGASLFAVDPAHLFWSRIEASQIVASSAAAFGGGLLAVWLARSWSVGAGVASMLWMPVTRYFYAGTLALAALPVMVVVAGWVAGKSRAAAGRVLPLVMFGAVLWLGSSTALHFVATGHWQPKSSFSVYGRNMILPHDPEGRFRDLSVPAQVGVQAGRWVRNGVALLAHMAYDRPRFSNWLMMAQPDPEHRRSVPAVVFVLLVPAVGCMVGASRAPGALAVVLWLATLPVAGLFSVDPEPRRVVGLLAAQYALIGIYFAWVARAVSGSVRDRRIVLGMVTLVAIALLPAGLSSHLLTGREDPGIVQLIRYVAPIYRENDAIFHNIVDRGAADTLAFGNAGAFAGDFPCLELIDTTRAPPNSQPACTFGSDLYRNLFTKAVVERRIEAFSPRRSAYVLLVRTRTDADYVVRLQERWPTAKVDRAKFLLPPEGMTDVTVVSLSD